MSRIAFTNKKKAEAHLIFLKLVDFIADRRGRDFRPKTQRNA